MGLFGWFQSSIQSKYSPKRVIITSMKSAYALGVCGGEENFGTNAQRRGRVKKTRQNVHVLRQTRQQPCVPAVAFGGIPVRPADSGAQFAHAQRAPDRPAPFLRVHTLRAGTTRPLRSTGFALCAFPPWLASYHESARRQLRARLHAAIDRRSGPSSHAARSSSPCSSVTSGSQPSTRFASEMSAKQWRMSPARYLPVIAGCRSERPMAAIVRSATSFTRHRLAAGDIDGQPRGCGSFERQAASARHIVDTDEIPLLQAVFEDQRRLSVQHAGREVTQHAGIRIRERLIWSVGIEEAQRHRRDSIGAAQDQA